MKKSTNYQLPLEKNFGGKLITSQQMLNHQHALATIGPTFNNSHYKRCPTPGPKLHFKTQSQTIEHKHLGTKLLKLADPNKKRDVLNKQAPKTQGLSNSLSKNRSAKKDNHIDNHRIELYHCYKKLNNMQSKSDFNKNDNMAKSQTLFKTMPNEYGSIHMSSEENENINEKPIYKQNEINLEDFDDIQGVQRNLLDKQQILPHDFKKNEIESVERHYTDQLLMFIVKNRIQKETEVLQTQNVFKKVNQNIEKNHKLIEKIIFNVQNELE